MPPLPPAATAGNATAKAMSPAAIVPAHARGREKGGDASADGGSTAAAGSR
jgi:hypothetical protein